MSTQDGRVEALLNVRCIVKAYHLCVLSETSVKCSLQSLKLFKVVNHRGQLGHLQSDLVDPLWPLHADISVLTNNPGKQI